MQLTIGHHRVDGKQVALPKPLAILQKASATPGEVAYEVVGVIRSKYHFKTRPLALIAAPENGRKRVKTAAPSFFKAQPKAADGAQ